MTFRRGKLLSAGFCTGSMRLRKGVGDPAATDINRIRLRFTLDNKLAYDTVLDVTMPPEQFALPVAGAKKFTSRRRSDGRRRCDLPGRCRFLLQIRIECEQALTFSCPEVDMPISALASGRLLFVPITRMKLYRSSWNFQGRHKRHGDDHRVTESRAHSDIPHGVGGVTCGPPGCDWKCELEGALGSRAGAIGTKRQREWKAGVSARLKRRHCQTCGRIEGFAVEHLWSAHLVSRHPVPRR